MSIQKEDAFPSPSFVTPNGEILYGTQGLTKLEYAAIKIMAGFAADPGLNAVDAGVARAAVKLANFLLAELAKDSETKLQCPVCRSFFKEGEQP